jgi:hypothetical protein
MVNLLNFVNFQEEIEKRSQFWLKNRIGHRSVIPKRKAPNGSMSIVYYYEFYMIRHFVIRNFVR